MPLRLPARPNGAERSIGPQDRSRTGPPSRSARSRRAADGRCGDTVRWVIADMTSGSGDAKRTHILVKPFASGLATDLVITTDRRPRSRSAFHRVERDVGHRTRCGIDLIDRTVAIGIDLRSIQECLGLRFLRRGSIGPGNPGHGRSGGLVRPGAMPIALRRGSCRRGFGWGPQGADRSRRRRGGDRAAETGMGARRGSGRWPRNHSFAGAAQGARCFRSHAIGTCR